MTATTIPPSGPEGGAYAWCRDYARSHDENFTVASWFLPKRLRHHFNAVYAFCRWTDDLGDEASGDRLALLDAWENELRDCLNHPPERALFVALRSTIETYRIPIEPFLRVVEANRINQRKTRFGTYEEVLDYCTYSATPVGRIVLHLLGYNDEERGRLADLTCTGLQLANFWQDVSVDLAQDRIYIPIEDLRRFDCSVADLEAGRATDSFRALVRFEVERTRALFQDGRQLENMVDRAVRADVSLFRKGGEAVLDAIERQDYDVLTARPRTSRRTKLWLTLTTGLRVRLGI